MKKDLNIDSVHLRNDEHLQYHTEFHDLVEEVGPEQLMVEPQFEVYCQRLEDEDTALLRINRSLITEDINVLDARRNELFSGAVKVCKTAAGHFRDDVKAAGKALRIVFDAYGNLARKSRNEKSSAINNLLKELYENHAEACEKTGICEWLDELDACNSECFRLMKARNEEISGRTDIVVEEARVAVDKAHNEIVEHVRARRLLGLGEVFGNFLRRHDAIVNAYNNGIAKRQGRNLKAGSETPPQAAM